MDRYDPNEWSQSFINKNKDFCFSVLKDINERIIDLLRQNDYPAAIAGMDRMLNGAIAMNNAGIKGFVPFLATNSFSMGIIVTCGINDAAEEKVKETALAAFKDAMDFSTQNLKEIANQTIEILQSNKSLKEIRKEISPQFPFDVIDLMRDNGKRLEDIRQQNKSSIFKSRKFWIIFFVIDFIIGLIISAVSMTPQTGTDSINQDHDYDYNYNYSSSYESQTVSEVETPQEEQQPVETFADNTTVYIKENMHFYSAPNSGASYSGFAFMGEEFTVQRTQDGWAMVGQTEKEWWCPIDKLSKVDVAFNPSYSGELDEYYLNKLFNHASYARYFPLYTMKEMGIINENDSIPIYMGDTIAGYGYSAEGINSSEDMRKVYNCYYSDNYIDKFGIIYNLKEYSYKVQDGKYYFSENIGMGIQGNYVKSITRISETQYSVRTLLGYTENTYQTYTIVYRNGKYLIDDMVETEE